MTDDPKKPKGVSDAQPQGFSPEPAAKPLGRTLKVRRVGNSLGIVLPKDVLAKLRVGEGDELSVTDTPGGVALRADDRGTAELMKLAEDIMLKRRKVLKALAQ